MRNKKFSEKQLKYWDSLKGKIPWNKNVPCSIKTRLKISKTKSGIKPNYSEETRNKRREANRKAQLIFCKNNPDAMKIRAKNRRLSGNYAITEETRMKLSLSHKNQIAWNRDLKTPFRVIEKLRESHLGQIAWNRGLTALTDDRIKNSACWKGGISFEPYSAEFDRQLKELIRNRDNYQCQKCGMPECENIQKLSVHHIDYDKQNCMPSNLISLCHGCNSEVNANRKHWQSYFEDIIRKLEVVS